MQKKCDCVYCRRTQRGTSLYTALVTMATLAVVIGVAAMLALAEF